MVQPAVLVSLRSPLLLGFLKHRADDPELLYKYYLSHQSYRGALRCAEPAGLHRVASC